MKFFIPILAVILFAASCSDTEEAGPESVSPNVSESVNQTTAGENSEPPETASGSPASAASDPGDKKLDPARDGWQVIVPAQEEREYVRERVFQWPSAGGRRVDVLSTEFAVDKQFELGALDPRVKAPHFDGPFRVEILSELTFEGTVFGYMLWLRGVGVGNAADPEKQRARNRNLTLRIFDKEGNGKFEPVSEGYTRVPNWVLNREPKTEDN